MPTTYDSLATTRLTSTTDTITLSSIPQGYTDLRIVLSGTVTQNCDPVIYFNGQTYKNGGVLLSLSYSAGTQPTATFNDTNVVGWYGNYSVGNFRTGSVGMFIVDLFSYSNTSYNKGYLVSYTQGRQTPTESNTVIGGGAYVGTSAISSVTFFAQSGSAWQVGTQVSIYGILRA